MAENATNPRGPVLRIVSVNDVYSLDNLPRLKTLVRAAAARPGADAFIVVLAGDFIAPSLLSSLDSGRAMVACMNDVGITHAIFGNHEDDVSIDELHRRIAEFRGKWISTNVHGFDAALPEHDVIGVASPGGRSVKVGLVGVVMSDPTVYRRPPFGGAAIEEANASARRAAALLRAQGCATVVPLTHQPIPDDQALAREETSPPFPIIVGGHEHAPYLERVGATWIVKTGSEANEAAIIELRWPPEAPPPGGDDAPSVSVELEPVTKHAEDPELRAMVDASMRPVHELETAVLFTIEPGASLSSIGGRVAQTSFGAFVCSLLRDTLGADGCVFNGGGIRAGRAYTKHVTYGDIKAELPFDNEIVVARMPGAVVRAAVVASRSHLPLEFGGFLQVDDRMHLEGDAPTIGGAAFEADREYRIAIVRNLFEGMDRIEPLVAFAKAFPEKIPPHGAGRECKVVLLEALSVALWKKLGAFAHVDAGHDGVIDEAELARAVAEVTHEAASTTTVKLIMNAIDKDRDRLISEKEAASVEGSDEPS